MRSKAPPLHCILTSPVRAPAPHPARLPARAPRVGLLAAVGLGLSLVAACSLGRYTPPEGTDGDAGPTVTVNKGPLCSGPCHGDESTSAPPRDTLGNNNPTARGVGAHRAHLGGSTWHKAIACETCHVVPKEIGDPGHIDTELPAEVVTAGLGEGMDWNGTTCTNSYCHGSALTGGTLTEPTWTHATGDEKKCGGCHGAPPPAPHPQDADCGKCHPTMNPGEGLVIAYPDLHIDGHLDVIDAQPCDSCHGESGNSAPPVDTTGHTATSARGVGAHQAHMGASSWHKQVDCAECHKVPAGISDQGHVDTPLPAEVIFGTLAGADGAWNGTSCSNTYCHGATLTGGNATSPTWTRVDESQNQCGSCHGAPPPAPHPQDADCGSCHPTMTAGGGMTITYPALHIDGKVDVVNDQPCDSCHGSGGDPAPPQDTQGNTATSFRGVGAHQSHLQASTWFKPIACNECHLVPTSVEQVGHIDTPLPAEVLFGTLAGNASWNGSTCAGTYCHGSTLTGGTSTNPVWTNVNGAQGQCGSCHGTPPPPPHPVDSDCGSCHDTMTKGGGLVITDPSRHIDGNLDVNTDQACDSCHGSGGNAAPPKAVGGATATTARGVGAHRSHLGSSNWHAQVDCTDCHRVPATVESVGHIDTPLPAELTFSSKAGPSTQWNGSRCSNNYCHGSTLTGGSATAPLWTQVDGSQNQCGSCHGAPPPAPHPTSTDCGQCHDDMTPGGGMVITDPSRHIDGNVNVNSNQACDSCHGSGGDPAPPQDTLGNTATTARGVGAHQSHLGVSGSFKPLTCNECHMVPGTVNSAGHIDTPLPAELIFSGLASGTAWNGSTCTNSYCHGAGLGSGGGNAGGNATQPTWTTVNGSQAQCQSCHGMPPPAPHPNDSSCENCHGQVAGPNHTIIAPNLHVDGTVQVTSVHPAGYDALEMHGYDFDRDGPSSCATAACHGVALTGGASNVSCESCHSGWQANCTFCHGGGSNNTGAPPASVFGLTAATAPEVGAHTAHVTASGNHVAFDCSTCHVKPSAALTPGHIDGNAGAEVVFGGLNPAATYNVGNASCSNMYCHGTGLSSNGSATWTSTTAMTCHSCHGDFTAGSLPGHGDHTREKCNSCHSTVVDTNKNITSAALHVNGTREVVFARGGTWDPSTKRCTNIACHSNRSW